MKQLMSIIVVVVFAGSTLSCGSGSKSKQIKEYKYTEERQPLQVICNKGWRLD